MIQLYRKIFCDLCSNGAENGYHITKADVCGDTEFDLCPECYRHLVFFQKCGIASGVSVTKVAEIGEKAE